MSIFDDLKTEFAADEDLNLDTVCAVFAFAVSGGALVGVLWWLV